jgi:hypothetical protein
MCRISADIDIPPQVLVASRDCECAVQHILLLLTAACTPLSWHESVVSPPQCSMTYHNIHRPVCCTAFSIKEMTQKVGKRRSTSLDKLFKQGLGNSNPL